MRNSQKMIQIFALTKTPLWKNQIFLLCFIKLTSKPKNLLNHEIKPLIISIREPYYFTNNCADPLK